MLFDMKSLKLKQRDRSPGLAASQHARPAALSLLLGYGGREAVGWRVGRPGYLRPVKMRRDGELMRCKPLLRRAIDEPETDCGRLASRTHLGLTGARRAAFTIETLPGSGAFGVQLPVAVGWSRSHAAGSASSNAHGLGRKD